MRWIHTNIRSIKYPFEPTCNLRARTCDLSRAFTSPPISTYLHTSLKVPRSAARWMSIPISFAVGMPDPGYRLEAAGMRDAAMEAEAAAACAAAACSTAAEGTGFGEGGGATGENPSTGMDGRAGGGAPATEAAVAAAKAAAATACEALGGGGACEAAATGGVRATTAAGTGGALVVMAGAAGRPGTVVVGKLAASVVAGVPGTAAAAVLSGVAEENPGRDPRGDGAC